MLNNNFFVLLTTPKKGDERIRGVTVEGNKTSTRISTRYQLYLNSEVTPLMYEKLIANL